MSWLRRIWNWIRGREETPPAPPATPRPIPGPTPVPVPPVPTDPHVPPAPADDVVPPEPPTPRSGRLSATHSRLWIVPDKPFPTSDKPQGFKTGEKMTLMVLAADDLGRAMPGVSVRGIIDATDGSALETIPTLGITGADGTVGLRYTMRPEDQILHGSKAIVAVLLDPVDGHSVKPRNAILWDDLDPSDVPGSTP